MELAPSGIHPEDSHTETIILDSSRIVKSEVIKLTLEEIYRTVKYFQI